MRCCYFVSPHLNPVAADTVIVTAISHGLNKLLLLLLLLLLLPLSLSLHPRMSHFFSRDAGFLGTPWTGIRHDIGKHQYPPKVSLCVSQN
jgi:hypothetical protein